MRRGKYTSTEIGNCKTTTADTAGFPRFAGKTPSYSSLQAIKTRYYDGYRSENLLGPNQ